METLGDNEESPENAPERLSDKIYYVQSPEDESVLVAMDVEIDRQQQLVRWLDTVKERLMRYQEILSANPENFSFRRHQDEGGGTYTFAPMSLEIYSQKVKERLIDGKDFNKLEGLLTAFEETRKNMW